MVLVLWVLGLVGLGLAALAARLFWPGRAGGAPEAGFAAMAALLVSAAIGLVWVWLFLANLMG